MKQQEITIIQKNELLSAMRELLQEEISKITLPAPQSADRLITRKQAAKELGITLPTLDIYTKAYPDKLPVYRLGKSIRFKLSEVLAAYERITKYSRQNTVQVDTEGLTKKKGA